MIFRLWLGIFLAVLACLAVDAKKIGTSNLSSVSGKSASMGFSQQSKKMATKSSEKSSTNSIDQDGSDIAYYMDFTIADQNFSLIVDTGSYYTWVYGANCKSDACKNRHQYGQNNSSSTKNTTEKFSITYSTGVVKGNVVNDKAQFGGFDTRINFGVAQEAGDTFASFPIDGLLGLSAKDESEKAPGVITTLKKQGLIDKRVFGINLGRSWDPKDEGGITFGGVDESKYSGDISYTKVESSNSLLWNLPLDGAYLYGKKIDFGEKRSCIVDTGTTLIVMPKDDAKKVHEKIDGMHTDGENYAVPCNTNVTFEFEFNGKKWAMSSKDFIGPELDENDGYCATNIQGLDIPNQSKQWILGDAFLKSVYSVFDMDNQKVGFAKKSSSKTNETPKDSLVLSSGLYHTLMPSYTGQGKSAPTPSATATSHDKHSGASAPSTNVFYSLLISLLIIFISL
ncbi:hypothetical protein TRICI_004354 [Trichomonascus ciferrii]|uniref:Peptidase A1 domain-containing protein n=1 Tax=Trichomonascus ciferrii TaxID=44093 RepID=A0A642V181_9ASCO|nr:hypothetical protein TRICI_004354 [Trichomonascus ciferrii]